jgi:NTE family protein
MKVGLVLGAGGVVGASWLIGALQALEEETGWSPQDADQIVGTSAGAVVGSLTAAGVSPQLMASYSLGQAPGELTEMMQVDQLADELVHERTSAERYQLALALPSIGPGSWRMAISTVARPLRHSPAAVVTAWLPRGFIRTEPIKQLVERFVPGDWPEHQSFSAVACDYVTGKRVAFGSPSAPTAGIGDAVAASCAIPAFYRPVKINGRRYVDGGVCSVSNLDLLADAGLDLVVCLNPTSSLARVKVRSPAERVAALIRDANGRRLGHEARKLRERGTEVLMIQPSGADLAVMGLNLMARDRRAEVLETAHASTVRALRRAGDSQPRPRPAARKRGARAARPQIPRAA